MAHQLYIDYTDWMFSPTQQIRKLARINWSILRSLGLTPHPRSLLALAPGSSAAVTPTACPLHGWNTTSISSIPPSLVPHSRCLNNHLGRVTRALLRWIYARHAPQVILFVTLVASTAGSATLWTLRRGTMPMITVHILWPKTKILGIKSDDCYKFVVNSTL